MDKKFYYQILIVTNDRDVLVYWIRNSAIPSANPVETKIFIKNNLSVVKEFKKVKNIIYHEITEDEYDAVGRWYRDNSKKKDYRVVSE